MCSLPNRRGFMGKRVLLVDDSPVIHIMLRKVLEKNHFEVCGDARNGREGVEMCKQLSPDIIFMDITMPVMDGLDAAREIKKIDMNVRIIMLSAMGDDEIIQQARDMGIFTFLKKPFDDYKIISAIYMAE
jgi:two-component system, chemotaxis family, chemotaxis protein CheY